MYPRRQLNSLSGLALLVVALALPDVVSAQAPSRDAIPSPSSSSGMPADLGISFVEGSSSQILIQRDGRRYIVDAATHTIREADASQSAPLDSLPTNKATVKEAGWSSSEETASAALGGVAMHGQTSAPMSAEKKKNIPYDPDDDLVFSLPTGRRLDRHGVYINFTHRFPYERAFTGTGRGDTLLGLDDFSISSFGFRFGVTSKLSVMAYRSPSIIGRPIELMAVYNFLDEREKQPFNAAVRVSIDGQNNFAANFTENIELALSRSLGHRAQLYAVPTVSINNRPLLQNNGALLQDPMPVQHCNLPLAVGVNPSLNVRPCENTFSVGAAVAVDVRPTVAIVAEAIPTLVNGRELGIHRSPFSFGVKKKIWRHAFTLGFSNSPGTLVSNRAGTVDTYLQKPGYDTPANVFIGFDLTRQVY